MTRIAWMTDIHLNFVESTRLGEFIERVVDAAPDIILIGGDTAESSDVVHYLSVLDDHLNRPIYFVLGNHDFYFGSIAQVREDIRRLCRERENLVYLTDVRGVELTHQVGLVGHDGWADARIGDYERSMVMMNDYRLIAEFHGLGKKDRWQVLKAMGDEAAATVRRTLPAALDRFELVYFLTHVPPLREACWYNGRISDDEWAPHFTCKAVGDALLEIMRDFPSRELIVLCGHTHGAGAVRPLENMQILTGGAEYGFPAINRLFRLN
jgi:predicted MPP superfamily phosphohydrolase